MGIKGIFLEKAYAFPNSEPTNKPPISPGPQLTATASILFISFFEFSIAFSTIKDILFKCDLAATSGTIPPNSECSSYWLCMILECNFEIPFLSSETTEAAVSSQVVSIPKTVKALFLSKSSIIY